MKIEGKTGFLKYDMFVFSGSAFWTGKKSARGRILGHKRLMIFKNVGLSGKKTPAAGP